MNLPNKLSLSRILLIPLILFTVLWGGANSDNPGQIAWFRLVALILVVAATITDWLDGNIARKRNISTNLGKLLDPLADKLLVTAAFVAFVELRIFTSWPIILILCREFLVTGLRTLAAINGSVMAADRLGKHKTGWQLGLIITTFVYLTAREFLRWTGVWETPLIGGWDAEAICVIILHILLCIAVTLTVLSGAQYLIKNWDLVKDAD